MRKSQTRYLIYLLIQLLTIPVVMALFKFNAEKKVAAVQAGVLFVGIPLLMIMREVLKVKSKNWVWLIVHAQFLVLFAFPILGLRLMNWEADFNTLSIMGVSGQALHKYSNSSFTLMMAANLWFWLKSKMPAKA